MCSGNGCGRAGLPARQQAAFHDRDRFTASEPGKSVAIMAPDRADALAASQFGHDNMLSAVPLGLHAEIVINRTVGSVALGSLGTEPHQA
jgi:hypothetical protein